MNIYEDTYLPDIMHDISQGLLAPAMIAIIGLIVVCLFFLGQIIVEYFTERRHAKQNLPAVVNDLNDATYYQVIGVIEQSALLRYQKAPLLVAARNMGLPEEPLFALAQLEINRAEKHYQRRLAWTDTISKIAPLLGLMGTLIPLGPGIVALGQNDVTTLSSSLLLAFDATVCGLVCAILSLIVSKIRSGWYSEYITTLESLMSCVVDKADQARKEGVALPANYTGDPLLEFAAADKAAKSGAGSDAFGGGGEGKPVSGAGQAGDAPETKEDTGVASDDVAGKTLGIEDAFDTAGNAVGTKPQAGEPGGICDSEAASVAEGR